MSIYDRENQASTPTNCMKSEMTEYFIREKQTWGSSVDSVGGGGEGGGGGGGGVKLVRRWWKSIICLNVGENESHMQPYEEDSNILFIVKY